MSEALSYLMLGPGAAPAPCVRLPASAPTAGALYRARVELVRACRTPYCSLYDGGSDVMTAEFEQAVAELVSKLEQTHLDIGWAAETREGKTSKFDCHHTVVCRTAALQAIKFPVGCYHFETLAYGALRRRGEVRSELVAYDWRPGADSASTWAATSRGIVNSLLWLQGRPGVHFQQDF